jgi:hypothetical protein
MPEDIRRALIGVEINELFGEEGVIGQLKEVRFMQKESVPPVFGEIQTTARIPIRHPIDKSGRSCLFD